MKKISLIIIIGFLISCSVKENPNAIKGLAPVDVYLNLEEKGFTTTKNLGSEYGNSWENSMTSEGITYNVSTFSHDTNTVESIQISVTILPPKKIEASKQFFKYISSLPYENSNPEKTIQWIEDNFYNDKETLIIGDAKFSIYSPTKFARMLVIEKNN